MSSVRVRIAPSPTGSPHVGTAYMGLFNYAFARSQGGRFILRIEDTDQTRSRREYERDIFDALRWTGLEWDEGPDVGGPHGPYRQSERTEIYRRHAAMLLDNGSAYRCFCTPERLDAMWEEQRARGEAGYDGRCRNLSAADVQEQLDAGTPHVIRMKVPDTGECVFRDRLRGEIRYDYKLIDDQVLLKSDNFPTYHLANVVDDHLMGMTHIIRGEEWINSAPKHILLYRAFGWEVPELIHMPLLLNPDGSKLSKRKNPTSILYYQAAGYLPEALLNYLGLMSYTRPDEQEKYTLDAFVSDFDIDRISLGGAVFDLQKLKWLNGRYLREDYTPHRILERLKEWRLNDDFMIKTIPMMHKRLETLGDFIPAVDFLFSTGVEYDPELLVPKNRTLEDVAPVIQTVLYRLDETDAWDAPGIDEAVKHVAAFWEWPVRDVTAVLFAAVMGRRVGPPLFDSMAVLGPDVTRRRLLDAMDRAGGLGKKKLKKLEKDWAGRRP